MEHTNKDILFTIQIPETVYETFQEYQKRFKPHTSIDKLMAESIIDEALFLTGQRTEGR